MKQALSILILLTALICMLPAQNSPLTVTAPNGGETWQAGSPYAITWSQVNLAGTVSITLIGADPSAPGMIMIAPSVPVTDQNFNWTIPPNVAPGTNYLVRVALMHAGMQVFDVSDAPFTIEGGTPPPPPPPPPNSSITVTAPNGGDIWAAGSNQTITWNFSNLEGEVRICLVQSINAPQIVITEATPIAAGSYAWIIPATIPPGMYKVHVVWLSNLTVYFGDLSDGYFEITNDTPPPPPPSLTLTAPNGGEIWTKGSVYDITWTQSNVTGNVTLMLMGPSGGLIAHDVPATAGTFSWTVPQNILPANHYCVKIFRPGYQGGFVFDLSDSTFTITDNGTPPPQPSLVLTSPNGGEIWQAGTTQPITWTFEGTQGFVRLQLMGAPNTPFRPIALHVPATAGTFNWHIPRHLVPSGDYRVMVSLLGNSNVPVEDISDADFTISAAAVDSTQIVVTSPNGGESWAKNTIQTITWTATEYTGNVRVFLVRGVNQHQHRRLIVPETPNTGSCEWTVPPNIPAGANYRIIVKKIGGPGLDMSDAPFSIIDAPVNVKVSPNPTHRGTEISFEVKFPLTASVRVFNIKGQLVRSLAEQKTMSGDQSFHWDGNDSQGRKVAAGIYFARISSPQFNASQKIMLLK